MLSGVPENESPPQLRSEMMRLYRCMETARPETLADGGVEVHFIEEDVTQRFLLSHAVGTRLEEISRERFPDEYPGIDDYWLRRKKRLAAQGIHREAVKHVPSPFTSEKVPGISLGAYIYHLLQGSRADCGALVVALILCARCTEPSREDHIILDRFTAHRLFLACLVLAVKLVSDIHYTNAFYATQVGGVSTKELNFLEKTLLLCLKFNVHVTTTQFCGSLSPMLSAFAKTLGDVDGAVLARAFSDVSMGATPRHHVNQGTPGQRYSSGTVITPKRPTSSPTNGTNGSGRSRGNGLHDQGSSSSSGMEIASPEQSPHTPELLMEGIIVPQEVSSTEVPREVASMLAEPTGWVVLSHVSIPGGGHGELVPLTFVVGPPGARSFVQVHPTTGQILAQKMLPPSFQDSRGDGGGGRNSNSNTHGQSQGKVVGGGSSGVRRRQVVNGGSHNAVTPNQYGSEQVKGRGTVSSSGARVRPSRGYQGSQKTPCTASTRPSTGMSGGGRGSAYESIITEDAGGVDMEYSEGFDSSPNPGGRRSMTPSAGRSQRQRAPKQIPSGGMGRPGAGDRGGERQVGSPTSTCFSSPDTAAMVTTAPGEPPRSKATPVSISDLPEGTQFTDAGAILVMSGRSGSGGNGSFLPGVVSSPSPPRKEVVLQSPTLAEGGWMPPAHQSTSGSKQLPHAHSQRRQQQPMLTNSQRNNGSRDLYHFQGGHQKQHEQQPQRSFMFGGGPKIPSTTSSSSSSRSAMPAIPGVKYQRSSGSTNGSPAPGKKELGRGCRGQDGGDILPPIDSAVRPLSWGGSER